MKKTMLMMVLSLMSISLIANEGKDKEKAAAKPVITNYTEVLSQIKYPIESRRQAVEGLVEVQFFVDRQGNMKRYKILNSPCSNLTTAVEDVLHELTFQAAYVDGKSVSSKITIPVDFKLK